MGNLFSKTSLYRLMENEKGKIQQAHDYELDSLLWLDDYHCNPKLDFYSWNKQKYLSFHGESRFFPSDYISCKNLVLTFSEQQIMVTSLFYHLRIN